MNTPRSRHRIFSGVNEEPDKILEIDDIADAIFPATEPKKFNHVPRLLIRILTLFPEELIKEISDRSDKLRKTSKLPMLFLLTSSGWLAGYSAAYFKLFGELLVEGASLDAALMAFSLLGVACASQILQLVFLNLSMKYYDQLDVIPIFMTAFLVFGIVCGMVFLDEWREYTWLGFFLVSLGSIMCMGGIAVVVLKNNNAAKSAVESNREGTDNEATETNEIVDLDGRQEMQEQR